MKNLKAIKTFKDKTAGVRNAGEEFKATNERAEELEAGGWVEILGDDTDAKDDKSDKQTKEDKEAAKIKTK